MSEAELPEHATLPAPLHDVEDYEDPMARCVQGGCPCGTKGKRARPELIEALRLALQQHLVLAAHTCACGEVIQDLGAYLDHRTAVVIEGLAAVLSGTDPLHPRWAEAIRLLLEPA